jgi:hypothetical protein
MQEGLLWLPEYTILAVFLGVIQAKNAVNVKAFQVSWSFVLAFKFLINFSQEILFFLARVFISREKLSSFRDAN